jgi:hypothetical protein
MFNFPSFPWSKPKVQPAPAQTVAALVKKIQYGKAFRDW